MFETQRNSESTRLSNAENGITLFNALQDAIGKHDVDRVRQHITEAKAQKFTFNAKIIWTCYLDSKEPLNLEIANSLLESDRLRYEDYTYDMLCQDLQSKQENNDHKKNIDTLLATIKQLINKEEPPNRGLFCCFG